jgi:hypothetical protein
MAALPVALLLFVCARRSLTAKVWRIHFLTCIDNAAADRTRACEEVEQGLSVTPAD